jgi:hypothetical protein
MTISKIRCPSCKSGKIIYDQDFYSGLGRRYDMVNIRCNVCERVFTYDEAVEIERKQNKWSSTIGKEAG